MTEIYPKGTIKVKKVAFGEDDKMPAGKYFVGDPCYVFDDDKAWQDFINICEQNFGSSFSGTLNDHLVVAIGTAYGDGVYEDLTGRAYPVDAGLLGAVPLKLIEKMGGKIQKNLGYLIEMPEDFYVYDDEGTIHIGDIEINTN